MKSVCALLCVLLIPASMLAQQPAAAPPAQAPMEMSMSYGMKKQYEAARDEVTKLAEKMPAEFYSYQPTPDVKTFAASLAHIAQSNVGQCDSLLGRKYELMGQDLSKTLTAKEPLVKALKDGFATCDEYFNKLSDNGPLASEHYTSRMMKDGQVIPVRVEMGSAVVSLIAHNNEMYGYMSVYLRLKGIVPPTSEPKK